MQNAPLVDRLKICSFRRLAWRFQQVLPVLRSRTCSHAVSGVQDSLERGWGAVGHREEVRSAR